jgi:hypothetical protein
LIAELAGIAGTSVLPGAAPGYLRYAVRDVDGGRVADPVLGILSSYPRTLAEQPELRPILLDASRPIPGATELRRTLFTLPTHRFVHAGDLVRMRSWRGRTSASPRGAAMSRRSP